MTLPPTDTWLLKGVDAPAYKVGPRCANPICSHSPRGGPALADHGHHIWRRSRHGKKFDWIELPDGTVFGNLVALCATCHRDITGDIGGHKAAIRVFERPYSDPHSNEGYIFLWCNVLEEDGRIEYEPVAPLEPQPPTRESAVASPATGSDVCPSCGQRKPARRSSSQPTQQGERRRRKTWPIRVPDDAEENGAEVLDAMVENLAPLLELHPDDNGRYTSARYYVVVPALYFAHQERDRFVAEVLGKESHA